MLQRNLAIAWLLIPIAASAVLGKNLSYDEIRATLRANPPESADQAMRENALLQLDEHLVKHIPLFGPEPGSEQFYVDMLSSLVDEIALPISEGARIWQMYNDGYIVKTPHGTVAFDLLRRPRPIDTVYPVNWSYQLPAEVLREIDLLMVSHQHPDHNDTRLHEIMQQMGIPILKYDNVPTNAEIMVGDLKIVAYEGHHDVTNHMFSVTTPAGLTMLHTGDNDEASHLPVDIAADILMVSAGTDARAAIDRLSPLLTIAGNMQELAHSPDERIRYATALAIDDTPLSSPVAVMAWGEHYDYNVATAPEPSTYPLGLLGMLQYLLCRRFRRPNRGSWRAGAAGTACLPTPPITSSGGKTAARRRVLTSGELTSAPRLVMAEARRQPRPNRCRPPLQSPVTWGWRWCRSQNCRPSAAIPAPRSIHIWTSTATLSFATGPT